MFEKIVAAIAVVVGMSIAFMVGYGLGCTNELEYNADYTRAAKDLISVSARELESGRADVVLAEWKDLQSKLYEGYEHRGNFKELANATVKRLEKRSSATEPADNSRDTQAN